MIYLIFEASKIARTFSCFNKVFPFNKWSFFLLLLPGKPFKMLVVHLYIVTFLSVTCPSAIAVSFKLLSTRWNHDFFIFFLIGYVKYQFWVIHSEYKTIKRTPSFVTMMANFFKFKVFVEFFISTYLHYQVLVFHGQYFLYIYSVFLGGHIFVRW